MAVFSQNLRLLRKEKGVTQSQLAEAVGLNRPVIGAYEEGRAEPKIEVLQAFAKYFNVSVEDLIAEKNASVSATSPEQAPLRILSVVVDSETREERIPLVPVKAAAGYLNGFGDPEFIRQLDTFNLPFAELHPDRTYRMFQIKGDSMLPIPSGAYIIGSFIEDWNHLKKGEAYVFVTHSDGIVYKRMGLRQMTAVELISDNAEYDPFQVDISDIREVWKACGYISFELPS